MTKHCNNCFYFEEVGPGWTPACCKHPDCFKKDVYRQTFEGEVEVDQVRIKDIVDFNPVGKCLRYTPFHYEIGKGWWIFKERIKVKGI